MTTASKAQRPTKADVALIPWINDVPKAARGRQTSAVYVPAARTPGNDNWLPFLTEAQERAAREADVRAWDRGNGAIAREFE